MNKVYTITIESDFTGRVDILECPTKADRSRVAGEYVRALSNYPTWLDAQWGTDQTIVEFEGGKRVTLEFSERTA